MKREIVVVAGTPVKAHTAKELTKESDWKQLIASFVADQDVRESSRLLYARTLAQYFIWIIKTERELNSLKREDILAYKDNLLQQKLAALTIASYLVVVRKFYDWTEANLIYPNIAKGIKTPARKQAFKKQHLTEKSSAELLGYYQQLSKRDYAIVNLIIRTGLRTIEVTRLNLEDITFKGGKRILKVWGKGRTEKDNFVVLTEKSWQPIKEYLATERKGAKAAEPLFVSNSNRDKGERMSTRSISRICKAGLVNVGLEGREYTAHSLRHTTAVMILKGGGALTDVQNVLRHSSPTTSQIYTESIREELRLQNAPETILDTIF